MTEHIVTTEMAEAIRKLPEFDQRFVHAALSTNRTRGWKGRCAIAAGATPRSAGTMASRVLNKDEVQHILNMVAVRVDAQVRKTARDIELSVDGCLRELANIGFVRATDLLKITRDSVEVDMEALEQRPELGAAIRKLSSQTVTRTPKNGPPVSVVTVQLELYDRTKVLKDVVDILRATQAPGDETETRDRGWTDVLEDEAKLTVIDGGKDGDD